MAGITLETAEAKLTLWLAADEAVCGGQSYSINNRSLTRADVKEIRENIKYWNDWVENLSDGGGIMISGATLC